MTDATDYLSEKLADLRQSVHELILDHPQLLVHFSYQHRGADEQLATGSISTFSDLDLMRMYLRNFETDLANLRRSQRMSLFDAGTRVVCIDAVFPDTIGEVPARNEVYVVDRVVRDFFDATPYLHLRGLSHGKGHIGYVAYKFASVDELKNDNYKKN